MDFSNSLSVVRVRNALQFISNSSFSFCEIVFLLLKLIQLSLRDNSNINLTAAHGIFLRFRINLYHLKITVSRCHYICL